MGTWTADYQAGRRTTEGYLAGARRQGELAGLAGTFPLLVIPMGEGRMAAAAAAVSEEWTSPPGSDSRTT